MAKRRANLLGLLIFPVLVLSLAFPGCSDSKLPQVIEAVNDDSSASGGLRKSSFTNSFIPAITETVEEGKSLNLRTALSSGRKGGLEIPAGSLSVGSEVTLEEAITIAYDQEVTELLDLRENAKVLTASDAVLVSSSALEKARSAMVLILPVPAFELKVANNPFENLVVIARVLDPGDHGLVKLKVINPDQISLTAKGVEIEIFDFGAYQATIISEKPSGGNKVVVSVSDIENHEKREIIQNILDSQELVTESIYDPASHQNQPTVETSESISPAIESEKEEKKEEKKETKIEISTDVFNNIIKEVIKISTAEDEVSAEDDVKDKKKSKEEKQILKEIKEQIKEQKRLEKEQKRLEKETLKEQKEQLKETLAQLNDELKQLKKDYKEIKNEFNDTKKEINKVTKKLKKGKDVDAGDLPEKVDKASVLEQSLLEMEQKIADKENQIVQIKDQINELNQDIKELKLFRITSLGSSLDMLSLRKFRAFSNPDQQGIVRLMMVLPLDASLYHEALVRKVSGWDPPHRDCTSDGEVVGVWNKADIQDGGALIVDDTIGEHASYRACVFDEDKNLIHTQSEDSYLSLSFVLQ